MNNHWIGTVSRSHVRRGLEGGFIQLNHGKRAPLQRMKAGDMIAMYSPRTDYPDGVPLQAFTAVGTIKTGEVYPFEMSEDFKPYRVDVAFFRGQEAPIKPLIASLSFIKDKTHWGGAFRFGYVKIPEADFLLIADGMGVSLSRGRRAAGKIQGGGFAMKMILTSAKTPDEYIACLDGWQRSYVEALHHAVREAVPELDARLKWGHIVCFLNGPVLLIRAEPSRVLFGFWRGQRLRHIEPRLKPGGKYEMATLALRPDTSLLRETVQSLAAAAADLNCVEGDPTAAVGQPLRKRAA